MEGNIVDITCLGVDLTERKRSEDALKKSEAKYRTMMEAIKDPVYISSEEYRIQYMNKAMIERVGYDTAGEKCYKAFYGFDIKCTWCDSETVFQEGHSEKNIVSPKDNRSFNVSSSRVINQDGSLAKISVLRDMTEFNALQDNLQQAQKMESIGTLAGGIAHDFNNILSPIMIHSEMAMEDLTPDDPLQQNIKEIYAASKRARDLVKQILTFAHKRSEEKVVIKSSLIFKEAVKFLRSTIPTTIDIRFDIKAEKDTVLADPVQLNQIIMNLGANASHAMREKGGLLELILDNEDISYENSNGSVNLKPGQYLKLSIRDTGTGIKPEIADKIFEPYFTTKGMEEGSGLGLATVHSIVQSYGGEIKVDSKVGNGTTFHVYIPLAEIEIQDLKEEVTELSNGNEQILLVDDEKPVINIMEKMLERLGYKVTSGTDSIEALEVFRNNPEAFNLVITDMTMPDMTGKELAGKLKKLRPDIPIILCTGFSEQIGEEEARKIGIDAFVMKPITRSEIANTIRRVFDKKESI